jgi:hypothetical protein
MATGNIGILRSRVVQKKKLLKAQNRRLSELKKNNEDPTKIKNQEKFIRFTENELKKAKEAYKAAVAEAKKNR